jgi:DNA modification methylase
MSNYKLINGDAVEETAKLESNSIHLSVFSPPFAELYVYSGDHRDMGNSRSYDEFFTHFSFLTPELYRVMMPGRIVAVHCMDLPIQKGKEGYIGLRDFSGMLIKNFQDQGFIYHSRTTIWKDPVVEMQRTKSLGLLHKQVKKDSSMSRVGLPDYVLFFRKPGENPEPIRNTGIPVDLWQKYASPVWYDINYSDTLNNFRAGRDEDDEKHICPLQLPTIERIIHLYSNVGDTVLTPFGGIGSEPYKALKMDRKAIAIELKKTYYDVMVKNCASAQLSKSQLTFV